MMERELEVNLSVWEAYVGGLAAVIIAKSHGDAKMIAADTHGEIWLCASVSRITTCKHPMRPRVVVIGGKA